MTRRVPPALQQRCGSCPSNIEPGPRVGESQSWNGGRLVRNFIEGGVAGILTTLGPRRLSGAFKKSSRHYLAGLMGECCPGRCASGRGPRGSPTRAVRSAPLHLDRLYTAVQKRKVRFCARQLAD